MQVDKGNEFYNKNFEALFEKYNIKMFSTNSDKKAQIIERINRTLKLRIGKLFDFQNSFRYIDKLQNLLNNYNSTIQTIIKIKLLDAIKPENYDLLINNYYNNFRIEINSIKYKVGDVVRIPIYLSAFTKEITGKWTRELFNISKINDTKPIT